MAGRNFITLDQWITEALLDTNQDGVCTTISCCHKVGSTDDEVYAVKIGERQWDPNQLAEIFMHKAKSAVQDIPSTQSFYLYAFYANRKQFQSKHHFRIDGGVELSAGTTEPATKEGGLSQVMRMSEATFQLNMRMMMENTRLLLEMNQSTARELNETRCENREMTAVFKEMLYKSATENHTHRLEEMKAQQSARDREFMYQIGPGLLNRITGKELVPESMADSGLLEVLIDSVDENSIKLLQAKLPPVAYASLAARATEHWSKKRDATALASKALEGRKDPVLDDESKDAAE